MCKILFENEWSFLCLITLHLLPIVTLSDVLDVRFIIYYLKKKRYI